MPCSRSPKREGSPLIVQAEASNHEEWHLLRTDLFPCRCQDKDALSHPETRHVELDQYARTLAPILSLSVIVKWSVHQCLRIGRGNQCT